MKQCRVSAFARVARVFALAAVALGLGAGSLLAQGSTGKIEGRVRDQAGAPIANAQVYIVGTAFNALTNPQGYYFINNVPAGTDRGPGRLHRLQVDPGRRREGARRPDQHGRHPAGADGGRDPGDHRRHPDPAAGAARRGHHRSSGSTASSAATSRSTGSTSVLALQPGVVASRDRQHALDPRRPHDQNATYIDGVPVQAGYRGTSQSDIFQQSAPRPGTEVERRHQRLRTGLGHHRRLLGRVRQRAVRRHLGRDPDAAAASTPGRCPTRTTPSPGPTASGSTGSPAASAARSCIQGLTFFLSGDARGAAVDRRPARTPSQLALFVPAGIDTTVAVPSAHRTIRRPTPRWCRSASSRWSTRRLQPLRQQRQRGHRQQLRRGLRRRPAAAHGPVDLPGLGQAQLHLRHRLAARFTAPPQPVPGPTSRDQ